MADATYQPKVYMQQGGDILVVKSGGVLKIESGGIIGNNATTKASKINDPSGGSTSTGGTATTGGIDTKARTAINSIINVLEGAGLSATG